MSEVVILLVVWVSGIEQYEYGARGPPCRRYEGGCVIEIEIEIETYAQ